MVKADIPERAEPGVVQPRHRPRRPAAVAAANPTVSLGLRLCRRGGPRSARASAGVALPARSGSPRQSRRRPRGLSERRRTRSLDPASTLSATGNPGGVSDLHEQPEPCPRFRTSAIGDGIVAVVAIPIQSATGDWGRSTCSTLSPRGWLGEGLAMLSFFLDLAPGPIAAPPRPQAN